MNIGHYHFKMYAESPVLAENRGFTADNNVAIIISSINFHQSTPILCQTTLQ